MANSIKLTVVEPEYHPEVLRSIVSVALATEEVQLRVFTSDQIWSKAFKNPPQGLNLHLTSSRKNIFGLIQEHKDVLENEDVVLFNTLATHYKAFANLKLQKPRTILRIHNAASTFQTWRHFLWPKSLYIAFKTISHILRIELRGGALFYRRKALLAFDRYLFPTDDIAHYVINNLNISYHKLLIPSLPFVATDTNKEQGGTTPTNAAEKIVAIPGSFNLKRRNYSIVYKAIKKLPPQEKTLHLHFLGPVQGKPAKALKQKISSLRRPDVKLYFYEKFVSEHSFNKIINQANFLILPLRDTVRYRIFQEQYGKTKVSGSVNDAIRFGKPALIPHFYPIPTALRPLFADYNDAKDLAQKIDSWLKNPPVPSLNCLNSYTVSEQAILLKELLKKATDH